MSDYAELCSDHKCGECTRCINATLTRERDAAIDALVDAQEERDGYKRAWQRDLEKGREFLAERDAARADLTRLQGALEAASLHLSTMSSDNWPTVLVETLKRIRAALRPPEVDPTSTPAKKESPGAPQGENALDLDAAAQAFEVVAGNWEPTDAAVGRALRGVANHLRARSIVGSHDEQLAGNPSLLDEGRSPEELLLVAADVCAEYAAVMSGAKRSYRDAAEETGLSIALRQLALKPQKSPPGER